MFAIEYFLLIGGVLVLASVALAKFSDNLGVPTLLLFLSVGMLAGSEGPGRIEFDDARIAQAIGIVALVFILFAAGLDTDWDSVRSVSKPALGLSTLGVLATALLFGLFSHFVLNLPLLEGLLLGAVVSSTDAAAVFAILRSKRVRLKEPVRPLLELEAGSNDPMAVFLTIGFILLITEPKTSFGSIALLFVFQMGLGAILGFVLGKAMIALLNHLKFSYEGIYPVFSVAFACLIYGAAAVLKGSGFLAVYIAGLVVGNSEVVQKRSLLRFFDGLAWLSQITMFVTLGLLVYPSRLIPITPAGLLASAFLMLAARPISVALCLGFSKFHWREIIFISWVGLRGAVPIILATFPLLAKLPHSELMFYLVFFIVLTSAILQGGTIPWIARLLQLSTPLEISRKSPIEFMPTEKLETDLQNFIVPYSSDIAGKTIVEIGLPEDTLIVLIIRNEQFIVPSGGTVIESGDVLQILGSKKSFKEFQALLSTEQEDGDY